ncbi:MAG: hypothetical protein INR73_06635 [Williamsia sp.]|nr:hypothetical protein [Williamsia sp.]
MAVEIRELVIRALVVNDKDHTPSSSRQRPSAGIQESKLVQECVNQVLKIIRKNKNR